MIFNLLDILFMKRQIKYKSYGSGFRPINQFYWCMYI